MTPTDSEPTREPDDFKEIGSIDPWGMARDRSGHPIGESATEQARMKVDAYGEINELRASLAASERDYIAARDMFVASDQRVQELERKLKEAREALKRHTHHYECTDCYYSCPKAEGYCGNEKGTGCNCGADEAIRIVGGTDGE